MAGHGGSPLSHVVDSDALELPYWGGPEYALEVHLPRLAGVQVTKFMVTEVIAAILVAAIVIPLARHVSRRNVTKGPFLNAFEALVMFIRDGVARPAIGGHGADHFLPYLWTVFFFVLFNNLLGLIPGMASATGNINVTAVLAMMTLGTVVLAGMRELGVAGFWIGIVPHMDVPGWIKPMLWGLMFMIEVAGLLIRHIVLAVRLFANMLAGHVVLAVVLGFILMAWNLSTWQWGAITAGSLLLVIALSLLELFVAFLQAYIFTFLSALFIGSAVHPH
ncbi:MAG: F0F1 ATP synthase subunit A [Isosphaeraceae bacterium]